MVHLEFEYSDGVSVSTILRGQDMLSSLDRVGGGESSEFCVTIAQEMDEHSD